MKKYFFYHLDNKAIQMQPMQTVLHIVRQSNISINVQIFPLHIFFVSLKFKGSPGFQFSQLSMRHCKLPVTKISSVSRTR